ncbi:hypothetical protein COCNU_scaffold000517G000030 [Cocos nucifera]|nr:hypothetical protein [Cocos nucifera]
MLPPGDFEAFPSILVAGLEYLLQPCFPTNHIVLFFCLQELLFVFSVYCCAQFLLTLDYFLTSASIDVWLLVLTLHIISYYCWLLGHC